jgi:hypothetical protein
MKIFQSKLFCLFVIFNLGPFLGAARAGKEIRYLRVGMLHSHFVNVGAEYELARTDRAEQQCDGLSWPAQYRFQDCLVAKSMWIGCRNYPDRKAGQVVPYKVVSVGPRNYDAVGEMIPVEFKMIGQFAAPTVIVDGMKASDNDLNDVVDKIDESQKPDRMIINKLNTYIGITVTRKIMAFSQQNHNNYFIYDYVFKNTGLIDGKGTMDPQTLTDVIFHFQYRYAAGHEAWEDGWMPIKEILWGRNTVNDVVGENPLMDGFEFRAQFSWHGPHSSVGIDDWGLPNFKDGRLGAPQYMGVVTLHADKAVGDPSDDLYQPFTTQYIDSDAGPQTFSPFDQNLAARKYEVMSAGHPAKSHAQEVGDGFADEWGVSRGGTSQGQGFGPYTLAPGDSIHIVLAEGVAGLSRLKAMEVGQNWLNDRFPFTLPDGSQTNSKIEYKKQWVQTGKDSLFQTFRNAITNIKQGYAIPQPPPPPDLFEVRSGGDRITLTWSRTAESSAHFDGYEIYRAIGRPDTTYEKIFSCNRSGLVNTMDDTTARRGFDYYYYIVAKDDGTVNDIKHGVPLTSSPFYTMTNQPAHLRRPAAEQLSSFRIVPNPFHIRARSLQFKETPDRIAFFGLPPVCTIKIYTERGDLIRTLHHADYSGDELWDSTTESGQIIVSGVYIVYLETPTGESIFRKLIVIR